MPRPVFLVGMMGSGKTTVGQGLAVALGRTFCDLDRRIERIWGRSVAALFEAGEPAFRATEAAALRSLVDEPGFHASGCIVATGGGVVIAAENRATMRSMGPQVLLEVGSDALLLRLGQAGAARPLLSGGDPRATLERIWSEREPSYREGTIAVAAEDDVDAIVARIVACLREQGDA